MNGPGPTLLQLEVVGTATIMIEKWPGPLPVSGGPSYRVLRIKQNYTPEWMYAMSEEDAFTFYRKYRVELINGLPTCPECGGGVKARSGKYGTFFGCVNWPKTGCQGKLDKNGKPTKGSIFRAAKKAGVINKEEPVIKEDSAAKKRAANLDL